VPFPVANDCGFDLAFFTRLQNDILQHVRRVRSRLSQRPLYGSSVRGVQTLDRLPDANQPINGILRKRSRRKEKRNQDAEWHDSVF
jgi:hypothetical protein